MNAPAYDGSLRRELPANVQRAATTVVAAMRAAGYPMGAVAATPTYFLAQRYGTRFTRRLNAQARADLALAVSRELGHQPSNAPSASGQVYA